MARRFGRSWSAALALALFFITFATYYTLRPLRDAPAILVEPESKVVIDDQSSNAPLVGLTEKEDGKEVEHPAIEPENTEYHSEQSTQQAFPPDMHTSTPPPPEQTPPPPPTKEPPAPEPAEPEAPAAPLEPPQLPPPSVPEAIEPDLSASKDSDATKEALNETELENDNDDHPPEGYAVDENEQSEEPPPPPPPSKILVMGKLTTEDTDWVQQELSDWQNHIYVVDLEPGINSPTGHKTKMNKAREAMPYLTYIVHHYPDFPDVVAFIHPHRRGMPMAWHNDARGNDAVNMMRDLRLETVLDRGYVNLRCNNEVGCPDEVQPFRDPPDPKKFAEHAFPYVYGHFFNATFTQMREAIPVVATQCCAQFVVSKEQILKRPKDEYVRYRKFLEETHYDDATVGRVMEYMWHIIFGRDAVHCENVFDCWCAVYGRCFNHGRGGGGFNGGRP
jgi:hypothetical protein